MRILSESESQRYLEELFDLFARHLVATVYRVSYPGTDHLPRRVIHPGFLLECRERWFYLTAGHNLKQILDGGVRVENSVFADGFGPEAISQYAPAFPFAEFPKFHTDIQEGIGLDLGMLEFIDPFKAHFLALFLKNRVIPLEERHWVNQDLTVFNNFFVLGFPENLHGDSFAFGTRASLRPTLIPLERIPDPDASITQGRKGLFCAEYSEKLAVDVAGASGGPIFGVLNNARRDYQIVGMQFAQLKQQRVAIGCTLPLIGYALTKWIESLR